MDHVAATDSAPDGTDVWMRSIKGWHVAFWVLLAVAAAAGGFDSDLSGRTKALYLAVLAALGAMYAIVGGPAIRHRGPVARHAYRVALVILVGFAAVLEPEASVLLFIGFPQIWMLGARIWEGAAYSAALAIAAGLGVASHDWSRRSLSAAGLSMAVSVGVSLAMGVWITRVIEQSHERAALIEQLRAARDELAEAHHASGVLAERERLAGEIHDTLAQGFTSIVMVAQTAQAELRRGRADAAAERLASIEATARDNLEEARALVAAFAPAALSQGTLVDALERITERFAAETGVALSARFEPSREAVAALHPSRQVVLLRAAQEALTNIRKHAGARAVSLRVVVGDDQRAEIEVTDDGAGFEPAALATGGYGLAGMRGRVEQVGGTIDVRSAPGEGTSVRITVPAGAS
jgi:signal transduction histidine kinase